MESPYNGRATINETENLVEIIIPTRKIYFFIIFIILWILPFGVGGIVAMVTILIDNEAPKLAIPFILLFWGAAMTFVGRILWWMIAGKEVIVINRDVLEIRKIGLLFSKPKSYSLKECQNFRAVDNSIANVFPFVTRSFIFTSGASGTIAFDYGMKTVKFAEAIDEAEGRYIIKILKEKGLLTDNNL